MKMLNLLFIGVMVLASSCNSIKVGSLATTKPRSVITADHVIQEGDYNLDTVCTTCGNKLRNHRVGMMQFDPRGKWYYVLYEKGE